MKGLRSSIADLQAKVEELMLKQEEVGARKVFHVEHLDLTCSASTPQKELPQGVPTRPLGHVCAHDHRGSGHGVVTTLHPTPVTGAKDSNNLSPVPFVLGSPYHVDASQF